MVAPSRAKRQPVVSPSLRSLEEIQAPIAAEMREFEQRIKVFTMGSTLEVIKGDLEPRYIHTVSFSYGDKILK